MFWYLISYAHNDLKFDSDTGASLHEGSSDIKIFRYWKDSMYFNEFQIHFEGSMTCVEGAETFMGFFLLSFEMQVIMIDEFT